VKVIRVDKARPGDLIAGTNASGNYPDGPRRIDQITRAPEHEKRTDGTAAFWLEWTDGRRLVYYADTLIWLAQRPVKAAYLMKIASPCHTRPQ
jgi:hypothetical protein